ncbi:MAG: DUF5103 domain-containing protein [Muribaculaceae bacterium]|nr:DUF5103 domain-containing protein [Muribaculaceae bacterium]
MKTEVFDERLKSLRAYTFSNPYGPGIPVLKMGNPEGLVIEFDILGDEREYLRYELLHCDYDWKRSKLSDFEAVEGMNEGRVEDYQFSMTTTVPYVHYRIRFPEDALQPKVSGNYILRIFNESDPDETLANVRFRVSEESALIGAEVTSRTDKDYNREHQQLSVTVDTERSGVGDLFNEVFTIIEQNGYPDGAHVLTKPLRVSGRTLIYEHLKDLIFEAGNEYHRFETVSNHQTGMGVDRIEYHAPYYNHYLYTDTPRKNTSYLYDETLHGGFVVREYNSEESDVDADYVVVHFSLEMPEQENVDIFIDSDAFQRQLSPESRMIFNRATGRYEKAALLKQGAYSYRYIAVPTNAVAGNNSIDGNKFQTLNIYNISVYSRRSGDRYDRLIGTQTIMSGQPIY